MGQKTFKEIVDEGMLKAGADHLAVEMSNELNKWLLRQTQAWPWPQLTLDTVFNLYPVLQDADTKEYYVLPTYLFNFSKVLGRPVLVDSQGVKHNITIADRTMLRPFIKYDDMYYSRAQNIRPRVLRFNLYNGNKYGKIILDFNPTQQYKIQMAVSLLPDPYDYNEPTDTPWYPNDDTMTKVVEAETLMYLNGPDDVGASKVVSQWQQMSTFDRLANGNDEFQNQQIRLSQRFKGT